MLHPYPYVGATSSLAIVYGALVYTTIVEAENAWHVAAEGCQDLAGRRLAGAAVH